MIKKYLKNRFVIAVIAIVFAMAICFVLVPAFFNDRGELTEIVRVKEQIYEGTVIEEQMLETVTVGGYNLPDGVAKSAAEIIGKYALATMEPGDYILSSKVGAEYLGSENYFLALGEEAYAMSLTINSFAAGLSGKLQVNDIISIVDINVGNNKAEVPEALKYVKVIAVTADTGEEATGESLPSTITVLVNQAQAEMLAAMDTQLTHFLLVYRGDNETAQDYLDRQKAYFSTGTVTLPELEAEEEEEEGEISAEEEEKKNAESTAVGNAAVTEKEGEADAN